MNLDPATADCVRASRAARLPGLGFDVRGRDEIRFVRLGSARELPRTVLHSILVSSEAPDGDDCDSGTSPNGRGQDAAVPVIRVLLLEDDAIDVRLIRACAESIGNLRLTCEVVTSVAAARACIARQTFDLCITDFWLGFESSLGLVAEISRPQRTIPVIVLTSLSTPEIRRLCHRAGAARVVGKESLSPGVLESAVAEVVREYGAKSATRDRGGVPARGLDFLDCLAEIIPPTDGTAVAPGREREVRCDPCSLQASIRAFAALSETARLAVLEQIATAGRTAGAPREAGVADLVEAVGKVCSLVEANGRPVEFDRPAQRIRSGCDEPALIFLAYELISRVSAATADRSTIRVELRREHGTCALHVSGLAYGGMPTLPVTFGALFTSILRRCHGVVEMMHDSGRSITLVARFPDGPDLSRNPRSP